MLSLNSKHVQHVKIYLACHFKVNLITHLEVIQHLKILKLIWVPNLDLHQIFDVINGFWVITKNVQFYHMFYF
jgi:hypothetical protein